MFRFRCFPSLFLAFLLTAGLLSSQQAQAQGACRFLSGAARTLCNEAAARSAASKKKAETPTPAPATANGAAEPSATPTAVKSGGPALIPAAQPVAMAQTQTSCGLQVSLLNLYRTGPGDVTADFMLLNTKNDDMTVIVYYGGANGRNTFLVDDSGTEWPKKRIDGNGNHRHPVMAGVQTKYRLVFHTAAGGQDARVFQLVSWFQLLPLAGMGELGFCQFKFTNVGLSATPATEQMSNTDDQSNGAPQTAGLPRAVSAPPVPANQTVTAVRRAPTQAPPANPDSYDSKSFVGLSTWVEAFSKEANNPADFAANMAKIKAAANGGQAKIQTLVGGAQRNDLQKFLTDHELYKGYYHSAAKLLEKENQCLEQRTYSAAETCDCVAGFPGDTTIGPGAGELVTESNKSKAIAACGRAAELATNTHLKARFTAQRARAQVYTMDNAQAGRWAEEAIAGGYRRAIILGAIGGLHGVEVLSSGFPVRRSDVDGALQYGVDALKASKKAGIWETFIVAEQFQEALANLSFSEGVLEPVVKSMLAPPPSGPCRQDSIGSDGNPISGTGCIGVSMR